MCVDKRSAHHQCVLCERDDTNGKRSNKKPEMEKNPSTSMETPKITNFGVRTTFTIFLTHTRTQNAHTK